MTGGTIPEIGADGHGKKSARSEPEQDDSEATTNRPTKVTKYKDPKPLPTNKEVEKKGLSKLTLTRETLKKFQKRQAETPSGFPMKYSKPNEDDHQAMCLFSPRIDREKQMDLLGNLLSCCFACNEDRIVFKLCLNDLLERDGVSAADLPNVMGKLSRVYESMKENVEENTEDTASHCAFRDRSLTVKQRNPSNLVDSSPCAFLVECTLERCNRIRRGRPSVMKSVFDDKVIQSQTSKENCEKKGPSVP